jgi:hypothetical protein
MMCASHAKIRILIYIYVKYVRSTVQFIRYDTREREREREREGGREGGRDLRPHDTCATAMPLSDGTGESVSRGPATAAAAAAAGLSPIAGAGRPRRPSS